MPATQAECMVQFESFLHKPIDGLDLPVMKMFPGVQLEAPVTDNLELAGISGVKADWWFTISNGIHTS